MIPVPWPPAINGPVLAMGRPRRPNAERNAVRAAVAGGTGSKAQRARRLAAAVAREALASVDGDGSDRINILVDALARSPIAVLAVDPEIDTAALIRAERCKRLERNGGRRLPERDWAADDRAMLEAITSQLSRRYERHLYDCTP